MAIIVSVAQFYTTSQQTSLLNLQTHIADAQALPQFEIAIKQKLNDETGKFDDNNIIVDNHGGAVHDFSAESAYFLRVTIFKRGQGATEKVELPVHGYFLSQDVSSAGTGLLTTIMGNHNNASFNNLARHIDEAAVARNRDFALLDERILVRLNYFDLLDRQHEDYYEVPSVGGGWRMIDAYGIAAFQKWKKDHRFELSNLNVDVLLDAATNRIESK
jgi:hypothetical protein